MTAIDNLGDPSPLHYFFTESTAPLAPPPPPSLPLLLHMYIPMVHTYGTYQSGADPGRGFGG